MRGGRALAIQLTVFLLLVGVSAALLLHPSLPKASSTSAVTAAAGKSSASARPSGSGAAAATPVAESAQAAQRNAAAVAAAQAPPGTVAARISIPRIKIANAPIYNRGTDARGVMLIAPGYAVTHYASSAPFGGGNSVLYGHDDIQGSIFSRLYDLTAGDLIQVTVGGQTQIYRVTGHQIVTPTAISVLAPTPDVRLTIITCWPFNVDSKRWIVTAVRA